MSLFSRLKTWMRNETILTPDLNNEFNNIINNMNPAGVVGYESTVVEMQKQTSPGGLGSESQATSLAGEIERLRYVLARDQGTTYWYQDPGTSLAAIKARLDAGLITPQNRIQSGRVDANNQPMFLVPDTGSNANVRLKAATTNLLVYIKNTLVTVSSDLTLALTGPSSYTAQINEAGATGAAGTKLLTENGTSFAIDTGSGSAPSAGSFHAWKVTHGGATEYFFAMFESSILLSHGRRGFFFDSIDATIPRIALFDNDPITLCRAAYIFLTNNSSTPALAVTYNRPTVSGTQPAGASTGDWWLDISSANNQVWKVFNGASFVDGNGLFIGLALVDGANVVAVRSRDFDNGFSTLNSMKLESVDGNSVRTTLLDTRINVYGNGFQFIEDKVTWTKPTNLDSGVTTSVSTLYYLYMSDTGKQFISNVAPYDRRDDLLGYYHPSKPWRCVGTVTTDGSSNYGTPVTQDNVKTDEIQDSAITTAKLADGAVTQAKRAAINQVLTASSGAFGSGNTTTYQAVTNLSASLANCTGRPIKVALVADSSGNQSSVQAAGATAKFAIFENSLVVAEYQLLSGALIPSSVINWTNTAPSTGTNLYEVKCALTGAGVGASVNYAKLLVYED